MITGRKDATIIGLLFLTVMATWGLGFWQIGSVLHAPDYLATIIAQRTHLFVGICFELVEIGAVLGITAMAFPLMRLYDEASALWYVCLRLLECALLLVAAIIPLALITLSQGISGSEAIDHAALQAVSTILLELREKWAFLLIAFFYGLSGIVFFRFLYKSRLVPRLLSIIGTIGSVLVLAGMPMDFFGFKQGASLGAVMGLVEIFLGGWLVVRGFSTNPEQRLQTYYQRSR